MNFPVANRKVLYSQNERMSSDPSRTAKAVLDRLKDAYDLDSDAALARKVDVASNTVASWRHRGTIPFDKILSKCNELDLNWVLKGEKSSQNEMVKDPSRDLSGDAIRIPIYEDAVGAGPGDVAQDDIVAYGTFFRRWLRSEIGIQPDRAFIAPVRGRSMEDLLTDGDLVLCERAEEIRFEDIYVCRYEGELKVKHAHQANGTIVLQSENDRYPSIQVGSGDDCGVIGRVHRRVVR